MVALGQLVDQQRHERERRAERQNELQQEIKEAGVDVHAFLDCRRVFTGALQYAKVPVAADFAYRRRLSFFFGFAGLCAALVTDGDVIGARDQLLHLSMRLGAERTTQFRGILRLHRFFPFRA